MSPLYTLNNKICCYEFCKFQTMQCSTLTISNFYPEKKRKIREHGMPISNIPNIGIP